MKLRDTTYEQLMLDLVLNGIEVDCIRAYDLAKPWLNGYPVVEASTDDSSLKNAEEVFKQVFDYAASSFGADSLEIHSHAIDNNCLVLRLHSGGKLFQTTLYEVYIYCKNYEARQCHI